MKSRLIITLFVSVSLVALIPLSSVQVDGAGESWLTGWLYRKSHVVNAATGAGTDYQVKVNVFYNTVTRFYDLSYRSATISGNPTDRHAFQPVHSTRIQEVNKVVDGSSRKYLAYDCSDAGTQVRLYYSDDIGGTWTAYSGNPILSGGSQYRWPAVTLVDGTFHMFLDDASVQKVRRYTSADGITYALAENVLDWVGTAATPFIWLNPNDNLWYLYHRELSGAEHRIRYRTAADLTDLDLSSSSTILTESSYIMTSPTVAYINSKYYLLTEIYPSSKWQIRAYHSDSATSGFTAMDNSPILNENEACPMLFLDPSGTVPYLFVTRLYGNWYQDTRVVYLNQSVQVSQHSQTDFDDIRFTDDDGEILLDYWLQEKTDSNYATFWVEIADSLSSATQTIYIYYGNDGVSSTSNGDNTFLFFDDFEDGSVDWANKWQSTNQAKYTESGGELHCAYLSTSTQLINTKNNYTDGIAVVSVARLDDSGGIGSMYFESAPATVTSKDYESLRYYNNYYRIGLNAVTFDRILTANTTFYFTLSHKLPSSGNALGEIFLDGTETPNGLYAANIASYLASPTYRSIYPSFLPQVAGSLHVKYIFVREYVSPEPLHGAWGAEEEPPTDTTPDDNTGTQGLRAPKPDCTYNTLGSSFTCRDNQFYGNMRVTAVYWSIDGRGNKMSIPNGVVTLSCDMWVEHHVVEAKAVYASGAVLSARVNVQTDNTGLPLLFISFFLILGIVAVMMYESGKKKKKRRGR